MYVSDSLFFLQHLFTDADKDEDHGNMFAKKLRDIIFDNKQENEKTAEEESEDIMSRMIAKSEKLSGIKQ
jgi:hypothetical protein